MIRSIIVIPFTTLRWLFSDYCELFKLIWELDLSFWEKHLEVLRCLVACLFFCVLSIYCLLKKRAFDVSFCVDPLSWDRLSSIHSLRTCSSRLPFPLLSLSFPSPPPLSFPSDLSPFPLLLSLFSLWSPSLFSLWSLSFPSDLSLFSLSFSCGRQIPRSSDWHRWRACSLMSRCYCRTLHPRWEREGSVCFVMVYFVFAFRFLI